MTEAAEGKLTDAALAKRVNAWLPEGVLKEKSCGSSFG